MISSTTGMVGVTDVDALLAVINAWEEEPVSMVNAIR